MRKIELLAPAGSYETFRAVITAGADAVYLGGSQFGARAYANNFEEKELLEAIDYAHLHGRQVYLTVNTLFKENELEQELYHYLLPYYKQGLDAVIIQDMGAFSMIRQEFPGLDIHTSTQMTVTGVSGAKMMKNLGATRVVTAREMSLEEIAAIHREVDIEIESFVHGALCYCYSGQCLLSSMLGGRSGNRGRCAQPCRLPYEVFDENRKAILRNGKKSPETYVLSPKDLCTISLIPELIEAGIDSFKIEGRMKQAEYAAGVVSVYREYLDRYFEEPSSFAVTKEDERKLYDFGNRSGFTRGYYEKHNGKDMMTFDKPGHTKGNEALQEEIKERYIRQEIKEKINGKLRLSQDFPATMELSLGETHVSVQGDTPQPAKKQPLTAEKVETSLRKTGNTPFVFDKLEIELDGELFLPVQSLNALRRDGLEALTEALLQKFRRNLPEEETGEPEKALSETLANAQEQTMHLAVSTENRKLLSVLIKEPLVSDVYLDSTAYTRKTLVGELKDDVASLHEAGKKAYFCFPTIFRQKTADFYENIKEELCGSGIDGVVVRSYDALEFVREQIKLPMILDQNLYTFNSRAKELFWSFSPVRDTVPYELNRKELFARPNEGSEMVLYGYLPLMTSAQCVHANMKSCDKTPQVTYLKDRYGKYFPVKNQCAECYNTIYNTTPLVLFSQRSDLERMGIHSVRISFTMEDEAEAERILTAYRTIFVEGTETVADAFAGEYTNGHYKRGVE